MNTVWILRTPNLGVRAFSSSEKALEAANELSWPYEMTMTNANECGTGRYYLDYFVWYGVLLGKECRVFLAKVNVE